MFIDDIHTDALSHRVEKIFRTLEYETILDICRRIRLAQEITRSADYQLWRLRQLSAFETDYKELISMVLEKSEEEIDKLYDDVIAKGYARDAEIYKAAGAAFIPYKENAELQQTIEIIRRQTNGTLENICRNTGFIVNNGQREMGLTKYFEHLLDKTALEIQTGTMSYDQAISQAVNQMVNSGMRYLETNSTDWVHYATPGKKPWHNRIDVAARRAVMTGVNQAVGKITDMNAEALKTDYFEVSAHATARPSHMLWQGRVYSREQLATICGLGDVTGLQGANCYHHYDAFIPGISKRRYTDEELADMRNNALQAKEWGGKEYTLYEATQRQRQMETRMRAIDEKMRLLGKLGNKDDAAALKAQRLQLYQEYKAFSAKFGLPEQINRVYYREN